MDFSSFSRPVLQSNMDSLRKRIGFADSDLSKEICELKLHVISYIIEAQDGLDSDFASAKVSEKLSRLAKLGCKIAIDRFHKQKKWS